MSTQQQHSQSSDQISQFFIRFRLHFAFAIMVISLFLIWTQWRENLRKTHAEAAAEHYYEYLRACQRDDEASMHHALSVLKSQFPEHAFTSLAVLDDAAHHLEHAQYHLAQSELDWVNHHTSIDFLKDLSKYKKIEIALYHQPDSLPKYRADLEQLKNSELKELTLLAEAQSLEKTGRYDLASACYHELIRSPLFESDPAFKALIADHVHELMIHRKHDEQGEC